MKYMKRNGKWLTCLLVLTLIISLFGCSEEAAIQDDLAGSTGYVSRSLYTDPFQLHKALEVLKAEYEQESLTQEQTLEQVEAFIRELEGSDHYNEYYPNMNIQKRGNTYGANPADVDPIGGGIGYTQTINKGKYNVSTADELVDALKKVKSGETIFVKGDAKIDMTDFCMADNYVINLPDGVTLASDRGQNGSKGGLIYTTAIRSRPLIQAGSNVRITGLVIQGPDPMIRDWKNKAMGNAITTEKDGLTVDNCEISGFNEASVKLSGGENHVIRNNYIHHNRSINVGYGVMVEGAKALIEYNLFSYNRNSVAGTHTAGTGLEVRNNVFLDEADECSIIIKETKSKSESAIAEYLKVVNNTFLADQVPFYVSKLPAGDFEAQFNYFAQTQKDLPVADLFQDQEWIKQSQVIFNNNEYGLLEKISTKNSSEQPESISVYATKHTPDMRLTKITSRIFYCDLNDVLEILEQLLSRLNAQESDEKAVEECITQAVRTIEGYDRAYDYIDQPNVIVDGNVYGVIPDDQPLGGGHGYKDIYTTGDYVVETAAELFKAVLQAKEGEVVFIKGDAVIDMTTIQATLIVPKGVTLASDRGYQGSPGALIYSDSFYSPMFTAYDDARITGLTIRGADPEPRLEHHRRSFSGSDAKGSSYYYQFLTINGINTVRPNLTVDNCEIAGFSHAAINLANTGHHIHHNYIHHNQRQGLGYGVCHAKAYSLIEYNLMNYMRHDIAGTGAPGSGYEARHNLQMGESLSHCFDMHGGRDRGDGTNIAGETILMHHNTFLSDKYPYWIRGIPEDIQDFYNNAVFPPLESYDRKRLFGSSDAEKAKFIVRDNVFDLKDKPTVVP